MELEIYQVDSFSTEAFKGNPAGVCITDKGLDESLMLAIAAEMAVSETAFLALDALNLRWFTPQVEVSLCGHGTLAVAHILQETGVITVGDDIRFNTLSGPLTVMVKPDCIAMLFPAPILDFSLEMDPSLLSCLGIYPEQVLGFCGFDNKCLIEIDNESVLLALEPNFDLLKQLLGRGIVVTARAVTTAVTAKSDDVIGHHAANKDYDFCSRYFAPWVGVNEDPVTGSAHCALAVYWQDKLNKSKLRGYQASSRGGFVDMELLAKQKLSPVQRVCLMGQAVTSIKGKLLV
ncbi:PhzF family phenazine biosynthesis protein [Shewanella surugensis]|uniref:PhzF family phenazine biosynthesis protein n=1 Tax=Shewanella surugensis TaxID=212020 RepID=A0ABT0LB65_9GAMM|nr:PhzF family phenazine biosynthesis protein [Shewanella surugensis]MCL1124740.1 PhzF family phenazine biosynthesis protein [Shewanella surugensis]